MTYNIIFIISIILLIPGIPMSIVPGLPSLIYMFAIALGFGLYEGFVHITPMNIIILAIIAGIAMLIDSVAGVAGAKWGGAHWTSILSGIAGLIIGSIIIPLPIIGSLVGMFLGVLISEWYRTRNIQKANKAAVGSFLGSMAGTAIRVVASVAFIVLFIVWGWN